MIKFINRYWEYLLFGFFISSITCWLLEIVYSLICYQKLVNPGTLSGPWCPVYGTTFLLIVLIVSKKRDFAHNFFMIFLIGSVVEYISSFISGEIFNNVIWDYSDYYLNINGRICLEMSFLFAIFGSFIFYVIEPLLRRFYLFLGRKVTIINIIFLTFFIGDILYNIFII